MKLDLKRCWISRHLFKNPPTRWCSIWNAQPLTLQITHSCGKKNDEIQIFHSFGTCSSGYSQKIFLLNKKHLPLKKSDCPVSHDHGFVDFFHIPLFLFRKTHLVEKKRQPTHFPLNSPPFFGGCSKKKILTPPSIHHHPPPYPPSTCHHLPPATQATHLRHFRRRSARCRGWGIRAPAPPRVAASVALEWHLQAGWSNRTKDLRPLSNMTHS